MQTFLICMLVIGAVQIFAGLIAIANRTEIKPLTPTGLAIRTFIRGAMCGWILFLLAQGVGNV